MNFQLEEELSTLLGPATGIFEATFHSNPESLNDNSDSEESWTRRGNRTSRRTARINAMEANGSDSDGEPIAQEREVATIHDLRHQIRQEALQGDVSAADQAIFEEYFGDRYRRPTSPTGRGWQNSARVAAGARIANEMYGPSIHAARHTSLLARFFVSAAPPAGLCAEGRARQRRIDTEATRVAYTRRVNREMRIQNGNRARILDLERVADEREDMLRDHRSSNDLEAMKNELNARAMAFKDEDPSGFAGWADHITVAHACSTSKSRQHQIVQWYTRGVPGRVLRQVRRVEIYYTMEQGLKVRLQQAQAQYGASVAPGAVYRTEDDEIWAGSPWAGGIRQVFFGYDPVPSANGFHYYVPKGEGAAVLKHLAGNFAARKVRLQHASRQHFSLLAGMMKSFVHSALLVLSRPEYVNTVDPDVQGLIKIARDGLEEYLRNTLEYEPENESSSSAIGVQGSDGDDDNESDGSDVASIANGMLNAARILEAAALDRRDGARIAAFTEQFMQGGDEEGAAGSVPADGEDDGGSASMDEGSSP